MRGPKAPAPKPIDPKKIEEERLKELELARNIADQQMLEQRRNMLQFSSKGLRI